MRRLITLISAGRNRTIVIRRELSRTENADWVVRSYRTEDWRILLFVRSRPVTGTVALRFGRTSMANPGQAKPAIPSSEERGFRHRRRVPSRPSGGERQRAAGSRGAAWADGGDARRWCGREWQAWILLCRLSLRFEFGFGFNGNGPNKTEQLAAYGSHDLGFFCPQPPVSCSVCAAAIGLSRRCPSPPGPIPVAVSAGSRRCASRAAPFELLR